MIYFNLKIQVFCVVTRRHIPEDFNHATKPLPEPQVSRDINLSFRCISPFTIPHFSLSFCPIYPSQIYPLHVSISFFSPLPYLTVYFLLSWPFLSKRFLYFPVSLYFSFDHISGFTFALSCRLLSYTTNLHSFHVYFFSLSFIVYFSALLFTPSHTALLQSRFVLFLFSPYLTASFSALLYTSLTYVHLCA